MNAPKHGIRANGQRVKIHPATMIEAVFKEGPDAILRARDVDWSQVKRWSLWPTNSAAPATQKLSTEARAMAERITAAWKLSPNDLVEARYRDEDGTVRRQLVRDVRWDGVTCWRRVADPSPAPQPATAPDLLDAAAKHMRDRAATYDKPDGGRSMARAVAAFNAATGQTLTEPEGWMFMAVLKMVRDCTAPGGHPDSQEDGIAYLALAGEARRRQNPNTPKA